MKEPALIAIIGVGGVLLGAVGGGIVQALVARGERRRSGRAAAVVLYIELHDAENAISDLRQLRAWGEMITDWGAYGATWALYRDRLASVLNTPRFAVVAAAFACLASLTRSRKRDTQDPQPTFDPTDKHLALYLNTVQRAKRAVLKASFRWWEMRQRKKALAEQGLPLKAPTP